MRAWGRSCAVAALLSAAALPAAKADAVCERPAEAAAVQAAALQQEMAVAALMCNDVPAYNYFVLSHRPDLQAADRALMGLFERARPGHGFDDYNTYKTGLANTASLRSHTDAGFCYQVNANFRAAYGRTLEETLALAPYPVETGLPGCSRPLRVAAPVVVQQPVQPVVQPPPHRRIRHRTWLGRLVDWLFH